MTSRRRVVIPSVLAALVVTLALGGCGDDDGDASTESATPASAPEPHLPPFELPPEFRDCMADEGIDVPASGDLPADIDPVQFDQALQTCAEFLHP